MPQTSNQRLATAVLAKMQLAQKDQTNSEKSCILTKLNVRTCNQLIKNESPPMTGHHIVDLERTTNCSPIWLPLIAKGNQVLPRWEGFNVLSPSNYFSCPKDLDSFTFLDLYQKWTREKNQKLKSSIRKIGQVKKGSGPPPPLFPDTFSIDPRWPWVKSQIVPPVNITIPTKID